MRPRVHERPIVMSAGEVLAVLSGVTEIRRPIKHRHDWSIEERDDGTPWPWHPPYVYGEDDAWMPCPFGFPRDSLWVRERYREIFDDDLDYCIEYGADGLLRKPTFADENAGFAFIERCERDRERWKSPVVMPRYASRLTLRLTHVRVEPVSAGGIWVIEFRRVDSESKGRVGM